MANSKRDVELVIRAKNEASKAIGNVEDALKALTAAQQEVAGSAGKTESTLSRLGKVLGDLNKQFAGATAAGKLSETFDRATASLGKAEEAAKAAADENRRLSEESAKAAANVGKLSDEVEKAAAAVKAQKAATEGAEKVQKDLNAAMTKAVSARKALSNEEESIAAQIERQQAAVVKASAKYGDLAQKIISVAAPSDELKARVAAANDELEKQEGKLSGLVTKQEANRKAQEAAVAAISDLQAKIAASAAGYETEKQKLEATTKAHDAFKVAKAEAAKAERSLQVELEKSAESLKRQETELERAKAAHADFAQIAEKTDAVLRDLGAESGNALQATFDAQRRSMLETKRAWKESENELKQLAAAMKATDAPSEEMIADFDRARSAASQAKQEYVAQRAALHAMSGVLAEVGGDVDALASQQQRFAAIQAQLGNDLARVRSQSQTAAAAQAQLRAQSAGAAAGQVQLASGARQAAGELERGGKASGGFAQALRVLYGESRQAMSWTQRLRGEVLSLVAAYAGIQGVIEGVRNVVTAFTDLEAAQSRLNAAFDGDITRVGQEMDFIRRQANRLGLSLTVISAEYGKFAVATKGTNLAGDETRKIFVAVAEAARVNKISMDDMQGVLNALTQIMSKGKVQAEELNQQLGDRLPGALKIMADGLGITTAELAKMMKNGEITSDALVNFADNLQKRYSAALPAALKSTSTALGELANAGKQALLDIANSGFIEKFTEFVRELTKWLKSAEGATALQAIGTALTKLTELLIEAVKHWRLLVVAVSAFIGLKTGAAVSAIANSYVTWREATLAATAAQQAANVAMATGSATAVTFAARVRGLGLAFQTLMSRTGIGLLVTAVATGLSIWATTTDDATEAMTRHREIMDDVKDAYDKAGGKVDEWAKKIEKVTVTQAVKQLAVLKTLQDEQKKGLGRAFGENSSIFNLFGETGRQVDELQRLASLYKASKISAEDFKKAVDAIGQSAASDSVKEIATSLLDVADETKTTQERIEQMEAVLRVLNGTATDTDRELLGLKKAAEDSAKGFEAGKFSLEEYQKALEKLKGFIPGLAAELKKMKDLAEIDAAGMIAFAEAVKSGDMSKIEAAINTTQAARAGALTSFDNALIKELSGNLKLTVETFKAIAGKEGFRSEAYRDSGGTPTIGFGSTRVGGRAVQMGDTITREDAIRQMVEDVKVFAARIDAQVTAPITDSMRDALISYAYNVGKVSKEIIQKINDQDYKGAQEAIKNGVNTVNGVPNDALKARRAQEAELFGKDGFDSPEIIKAQEDRDRKRNEEATKFTEELQKQNEQRVFETENLKLSGAQQAVNKALHEAEVAAQKAGVELTEEQKQKIIETTTALYNQQNVTKAAEEAEQRVNQLMEVRSSLLQQLQYYQQNGESDKAAELQTRLQEVNTQLQAAIQNAVGMWQAIGGPQADAAIAKLQTTSLTISTAKQGMIDWTRVGNLLVDGLVGAFDKFAQGIAEGKKATEAAREAFLQFAADFLRQIAQMILKAALLKVLSSVFPGLGAGVAHAGGVVGALNRRREVSPTWFAGAMRYHSGGIAGLKPDEVPTILQKGEEVLTRDDPRHRLNGGMNPAAPAAAPSTTKIINTFDAASFLEEALNTRVGEKIMLNFVRANPGAFKQAMGG